MKSSHQKEGKKAVSPVVGVLLMIAITVVISAVVAAFAYGIIGGVHRYEPSFYIQIEETTKEDHYKIHALNASDFRPLPNVTVAVFEHGEERLLSGPQRTNKTGCCIVKVPGGYNELFDIVAKYENETRTETEDRRPSMVKTGEKLGPLGIGLLITVLTAVLSFLVGIILGLFLSRKIKKS